MAIGYVAMVFLSFSNGKQVIIKLKYPKLNKVNINNVWDVSKITNNSNSDYLVYLHGTVSLSSDSANIWLWDAVSSTFTLNAGFSADSIAFSKLQPVKSIYNPQLKYLTEKHTETGLLPDGTYILCIYVMEKSTGRELSHDCIQITVSNMQKDK